MQSSTQILADAPQQDIRSWLKDVTHTVHERLHQQPLLLAIQQNNIDLKGYQHVLQSFLATYTYVQQICSSARKRQLTHLPALLDLTQHMTLLSADLAFCTARCYPLGHPVQRHLMIRRTLPPALAKLSTQALKTHMQQGTLTPWLLGQYYSLHGSRFGRGTLARGTAHLFASPKFAAPKHDLAHGRLAGRSFLSLKPQAETCRWPTFCDLLNQAIQSPTDQQACHAGAVHAFRLLEILLNLATDAP